MPICHAVIPDSLQLMVLLSTVLLSEGRVDHGRDGPVVGAGQLSKVGLRLRNGVHASGKNKPTRLGVGSCRSRRWFRR